MAEPEEKGRDITRRELADALAEATRLNKALAARVEVLETKAADADTKIGRELLEAQRLLAERTVQPLSAVAVLADVKLVPYKGMVRATAPCCVAPTVNREDGQPAGPHFTAVGEVFEIEVAALWTDDPYEAVIVTGHADDGTAKTKPNRDAPTPIDFRFRKVVSIAEDPTPRRAAEY